MVLVWTFPKGDSRMSKLVGWMAFYNQERLEIWLDKDAKDLWEAKQFAIKHFKIPKSKQGLLAIEPGYED